MPHYLVERYLPPIAPDALASAVGRLSTSTMPVRHLWTIVIPGEQTCMSLVDGPDPATVAAANQLADFPYTRIVHAITVAPKDKGAP